MKALILFAILATTNFTNAQVGIGTATPSNNAALDVNSTNKGIMLPRLSDTTSVSNPSAGLMIYSMQSKTPAFHNGVSWNSVAAQTAMTTTTNTDSITYTVTNASNGFTNGTFPILALSNGISNQGAQSMIQDVSFSKLQDINTIAFTKATITSPNLSAMVIEIKVYAPGENDPNYSIKLTNLHISTYSVGISPGINEQISILPVIFGYRDWINGTSFAWNDAMDIEVPY